MKDHKNKLQKPPAPVPTGYIRQEDAQKLLGELASSTINELEEKFSILSGLLKQDDWSFVIKSHAMIEAAVTQLILDHLDEVRLKGFVERLPLSDTQTGKIVITKTLNLLDENHRKFVRWFSELRNSLVHRLENISFTFDTHVSRMDENQRKSWTAAIVWFADNECRKDWETIARKQPKIALQMGLLMLISKCVVDSNQVKGLRKIDEATERTTSSLIERFQNLLSKD